MIRGMVERLATRLQKDGSDVDGWIQLVRSYTVLKEDEKARAAGDAARRALANDFIESLPNSYDTEIGEGGVRLSGGECQRLAIARVLVGQPRLLILDEPTNHLDQGTVNRLMASLVDEPDRPTILTISHDPEVVRLADTVFKLEGGRLSLVRPRVADAALG